MYRELIRPLLFRLSADNAHELSVRTGEWLSHSTLGKALLSGYREWAKAVPSNGLINSGYGADSGSKRLSQTLFGLHFKNPIGLAAGFDKNGVLTPLIETLGFGFTEIGSITARASKGNPKPRAFRLPADESLINRMGLNNDGAQQIISHLMERDPSAESRTIPLGVNIAKTHNPAILGDAAVQDYAESFRLACKVADYVTINISCPNTAEGKTFEDPIALKELLDELLGGQLSDAEAPPIFVKFSVDLDRSQAETLLEITEQAGIDGYVATNTSTRRTDLRTPESEWRAIGTGGLSGQAIRERSTQVVQWIYSLTDGKKPIIGIGGIQNAQDVMDKVSAGASLVQLYTALIYEGPFLAKKLCLELDQEIKKRGLKTWTELVQELRSSKKV